MHASADNASRPVTLAVRMLRSRWSGDGRQFAKYVGEKFRRHHCIVAAWHSLRRSSSWSSLRNSSTRLGSSISYTWALILFKPITDVIGMRKSSGHELKRTAMTKGKTSCDPFKWNAWSLHRMVPRARYDIFKSEAAGALPCWQIGNAQIKYVLPLKMLSIRSICHFTNRSALHCRMHYGGRPYFV